MTQNQQRWSALIIALMILSMALGAALVFGQGGAGRAPQNGAGRTSPKPPVNTVPRAKKATPAKKTPATTQPTCFAQSPTQATGRTHTVNSGAGMGMEFVEIPPGSFCMGSTNGQADEMPVHQVTINYSIYIGKYEVTQAQWQQVMGNNPSKFRGDSLPVEQISWNDIGWFINKLNQRNDGFHYRLPTEGEWEYACRAGTTGDHAGYLDGMAWYRDNSGGSTHPVGTKQPNSFGLYDMEGNVWEWCQDWYHDSYKGGPTDGSAWLSGGEQKDRVLRGGSWLPTAPYPSSAYRHKNSPDSRFDTFGFRVVAVR